MQELGVDVQPRGEGNGKLWRWTGLVPSPCVPPSKKGSGEWSFFGLLPKSSKDQWDCEITDYYVALPLQL